MAQPPPAPHRRQHLTSPDAVGHPRITASRSPGAQTGAIVYRSLASPVRRRLAVHTASSVTGTSR
jgi:hypothetical protein